MITKKKGIQKNPKNMHQNYKRCMRIFQTIFQSINVELAFDAFCTTELFLGGNNNKNKVAQTCIVIVF